MKIQSSQSQDTVRVRVRPLFAGRDSRTGGKKPTPPVAPADTFHRVSSVNRNLVLNTTTPSSSVSSSGTPEAEAPTDSLDSPVLNFSSDKNLPLAERLAQDAPILAKWFKPAHYKPGGKIEFSSLPQALLKGMEATVRATTPKKKAAHSLANGTSPQVETFIPEAAQSGLERAQILSLLQQAQQRLQAVVSAEEGENAIGASQHSQALLARFLDTPDRSDFSPAAFVDALRQMEVGPSLPDQSMDGLAQAQEILRDLQQQVDEEKRVALDPFEKECPTLLKYSDNWVRQGRNGQLPEVLMRRQVTERILTLMTSGVARTNLMLQAPAGEGKTYAMLGVAQRIANQDVPNALVGAQLVRLNVAALQAEGLYKGESQRSAQEAFSQLARYLHHHPRQKVIVFIDDVPSMTQGDGIMSLADLWKSSGLLEHQNLTLVGAMTPEEWGKSPLASDSAFRGRFQPIVLPKFSLAEQLALLAHTANQLEKQDGVRISPEIVEKTVRLASEVWPQGTVCHAQDLLRLAAALSKGSALGLASLTDALQQRELWLESLKDKESSGLKGRFQRQLEETRREIVRLKQQIAQQSRMLPGSPSQMPMVEDQHLRQALALSTETAMEAMTTVDLTKLRDAEAVLAQHIVGQPEALSTIAKGLREIAIRHKTGGVRNRPIVSMLLPGPTGVGKTEAARVIAKEFMKGHLIRLDMSDYMEKHAASLLTGSPPGYVGYEQGGLVDQVRRYPKSVVVFDEIEKAHPDVFNLLLQILGEGELRDNRGEVVSFRDAVVILTSNLNHDELTELVARHRRSPEAQSDPALSASLLEKQVRALLTANPQSGRMGFKPEHLGRIDYVIPFNPLTPASVPEILKIQLQNLNDQAFLQEQNVRVTLSAAARERLKTLSVANSNATGPTLTDPALFLEAPIAGGARSIAAHFDRAIRAPLMSDLALNPDWVDLENAVIAVDYDAQRQTFPMRVSRRP